MAVSLSPAAFGTLYGPGAGGPIPDAMTSFTVPGVFTSTINITDQGLIASLKSVSIQFGPPNHTWVGDLQIILTAPNGDNVHLISVTGAPGPTSFGDSSDFGGKYLFVNSGGLNFSAAAAAEATGALPVPPGTYNRETNPNAGATIGVDNDTFAVFNNDSVRGNWVLTVKDWGAGDTGSLASWTLNINLVPAPGSLALLAVAGLIGRPRRRRR
jgi:subtilisin-like proprotein convertase family protein